MALDLYVDKLPEDIREAFKQEIAGYIPQSDLTRHPAFQRELSLKHETTMATWQKEKLPVLIEEEIKKRGEKQPWEIEIQKLKDENQAIQRKATLKEREAQAITELTKHGLSPDLAAFVLAEDEAEFKGKIEKLTGEFSRWKDETEKQIKTKAFGQSTPPAGQPGQVDFAKMNGTELMNYARQSPEHLNAVTAWQRTKK
jgi:hypothetical protein